MNCSSGTSEAAVVGQGHSCGIEGGSVTGGFFPTAEVSGGKLTFLTSTSIGPLGDLSTLITLGAEACSNFGLSTG